MGSYSVMAGDRCLEAFNLELEARNVGDCFVKCGISFPNQILFETLFFYMWIRRDILNVGLKLVWKLSLSRDCI